MKHQIHHHHRWASRLSLFVLAAVLGLQPSLLNCAPTEVRKEQLAEITAEMFFAPLPPRGEVVINAGDLGRYRFTADTTTYEIPSDVRIRPALVDLLNELQVLFKDPVLIISGYHSKQHQIYLWAKWLSDRPDEIKTLNRRNYGTWDAWVNASQDLPGCPSLRSKHRNGDAVNFHWKSLSLDTARQRELLTWLIRKAGGTRNYTRKQRERFGIPIDDNYLLKVNAYRRGEKDSVENPSGIPHFYVVYRPSDKPAMPRIGDIGTRLDQQEEKERRYRRGDILFVESDDDYGYLAEVTKDTRLNDPDVVIRFFRAELRDKVGRSISRNAIHAKRTKPESGWGRKEIALEYFNGEEWIPTENAIVYEDYYLLPKSVNVDRKELQFEQVRVPIFRPPHKSD